MASAVMPAVSRPREWRAGPLAWPAWTAWRGWHVATLLAAIVALHAGARLFGTPGIAVVVPHSLTELEGMTTHWEHAIFAPVVSGMVREDAMAAVPAAFSTMHVRGIVPLYLVATAHAWLGSTYWAYALADALVWWAGALALYALAGRLGAPRGAAVAAGVLFASSPIVVFNMWQQVTHAANLASLPIVLLLSLVVMDAEQRAWRRRGLLLGVVLVLGSFLYDYQLIAATAMLALAPVARRRAQWLAAALLGAAIMVAGAAATRVVLALVGLPVAPAQNDPGELVAGQLRGLLAEVVGGDVGAVANRLRKALGVLVWAYHPVVVALALAGLALAGRRLRLLFLATNAIGFGVAMLYPVSWPAMTGYAATYACAGLAIAGLPGMLSARLRRAELARSLGPWVSAALLVAALASTNMDLFGDFGYVIRWWGPWYVPH